MHKGKNKSQKEESTSLLVSRQTLRIINMLLSIIVIIIILLIAACTIYALVGNNNVYRAAKSVRDDLLKLKPNYESSEDVVAKFNELRKINPDICAWLTIDNTTIDYPVVQGENNLKYINTDIYGKFSLSGSIFLDSRCNKNFRDNYNLVYGHHMVRHMLFGDIDYYRDKDFFDKNRTGILILPDRVYKLDIFACLVVYSSDHVFDPTYYNKDICKLVKYAKDKGLYLHDDTYQKIKDDITTQIIALSTCATDYSEARTVILAVMNPYKTF